MPHGWLPGPQFHIIAFFCFWGEYPTPDNFHGISVSLSVCLSVCLYLCVCLCVSLCVVGRGLVSQKKTFYTVLTTYQITS